MIPQQAMRNDPLSPHTPSPLPADADATVTGTDIVYLADLQPQPVEWLWQDRLAAGTLAMLSGEPGSGKTWVAPSPPCAAPNSISAFVAPKTENQVPDGGLSRLRRMSTLRSTRQDAQINYLSTLSIFMKQTTYLATLPNFVEFREHYNIGLALGWGILARLFLEPKFPHTNFSISSHLPDGPFTYVISKTPSAPAGYFAKVEHYGGYQKYRCRLSGCRSKTVLLWNQ